MTGHAGKSRSTPQRHAAKETRVGTGIGVGNGVILLLLLNYVVFGLAQFTNLPLIQQLPLYSNNSQWYVEV